MGYLLDTNIASYVIKGNIPKVRQRLLKVPIAEVSISVVTEAELRFGVVRKPDAVSLKIAVEEFLLRVDVLPWDSEAAKHYAQVRYALECSGDPMGNLDLMIAAHAAFRSSCTRHQRSCLSTGETAQDRRLDQIGIWRCGALEELRDNCY